ncbi:Crp/Fnr family transcriptional regulator [Nodosilinea sp. LEGE 07298]|uniref:Crp/Fnr family transcriptional regulator n=1 Tax=Nodosilinea sp. LEGE 07298 TaxID=2777970 RepID=UPI00187DE378|nr:Crp/Fnr family transcriptional regulator [Nodosilinea sp. LEGE 07298]MBE9109235.1 Crp/Fnr family transcriptional regulator [Nodosilinea sp. LEGE 07298]
MKATISQLASISVFAHLQPEQLASLQTHAQVHTYQQGETVMHEGDTLAARLYALLDGLLRVSKTATTGKETILRTLSQGDIFAAPALFGNSIAPATVTAGSAVQVLTVDREALLQIIQANPAIALDMMSVYNQRLQRLHDRIHGLVSERAIVRLARFIQAAAQQERGNFGQPGALCLRSHLSYYELARSIGITYEECVRLFKQLQGVVAYSRGGKITVLNWQKLEAIALGEEEPEPSAPRKPAAKSPTIPSKP